MKVYETRFNGRRPYCIEVTDHEIEVFEQSWDETNEYWSKNRRVYQSSYERIFIGDEKKVYPGNTMLLHVKDSEYVYIGHLIFKFHVYNDEIIHYTSILADENDIPSVTAFGKFRTYHMNQCVSLNENDPQQRATPFMITVLHTWIEP